MSQFRGKHGKDMVSTPPSVNMDSEQPVLSGSEIPKTRSLEQISSNEQDRENQVVTASEGVNMEKPQSDLPGPDVNGQEEEGVSICQFFLQGRCHFGNRCRLSHSAPESSSALPQSAEGERQSRQNDDVKQEGKNQKKNGKMKKMQKRRSQAKEMEGKEELSKKPRMRTADDVISRILWDPSLDPTDFGVGYLDRFLGVLERPFSEFSWDADLCNCDYSEELALPRHRIQYFTYRGHRVWDRESRKDGVFGSTGGPLEFPFTAGGDEEEGNVTHVTGSQEQGEVVQKMNVEFLEEANGGLSVDSQDKKLIQGENEQDETEDHTQQTQEHSVNETAAGDTNMSSHIRNTPQQEAGSEADMKGKEVAYDPDLSVLTDQLCLSQRNKTNSEGDDVEEEEWEESWEGEEGKEHLSWQPLPSSPHSSQSPVKEQRKVPHRTKPTHFIAFRADTPTFLSGFQRLQEEITALLPLSAPHWASPGSLHVTLCLLVLSGPEEVGMACEVLREFARKHRQHSCSLHFPTSLNHFGGRVLFLTPQPLSRVQSLNKHLQEVYSEKGWLHRDSITPRYHLTLAKIKEKGGGRVFEGVADVVKGSRQVRAINFGSLTVNKLYLCVSQVPKMEDGFYHTVCAVALQ